MGVAFSYRERSAGNERQRVEHARCVWARLSRIVNAWAGNKLAEKCTGRFALRRVSGDRGRQRLRDEKRHAMARPINANLFPTYSDKADARVKICQGVAVG